MDELYVAVKAQIGTESPEIMLTNGRKIKLFKIEAVKNIQAPWYPVLLDLENWENGSTKELPDG